MPENEKKPLSVGMEAFDTLSKQNGGVKMPLFLPDGTETDQFLVLRGADSKAFRCAQARSNRGLLTIATRLKDKKIDEEEASLERIENSRTLVASLVLDWSFEKDCDEENVVEFLRKAPQVKESIDLFPQTLPRALFCLKTNWSIFSYP